MAIVWGATFPLGKLVLVHLAPFRYLELRFALAAALMAPLAWRDLPSIRGGRLRGAVLTGAVLFCAYALQTLGLRTTTASEAGLITGLNVVIVPVLAMLWLRRPTDLITAAGVFAAGSGLWLLAWQGERLRAGDLLVMGCAVALAVHIVLVGRLAPSLPARGFATLQLGTVAVLGLAASTLEPRPGPLPPYVVGAIVFMAIAATLLAYLVQTWAQRFTSPVRAGLLFAVEPVAAVAFGVLWLGDSLSARQAVGAVAILAGVAMGEVARRERREGAWT